MGGLYEAVIDELCASQVHTANGVKIVRPKIVASTATVRRASQQMQALFGRSGTPAVFPAPAPIAVIPSSLTPPRSPQQQDGSTSASPRRGAISRPCCCGWAWP